MKISALFANKRTRVIVIVAAVVLVLAILTPIVLRGALQNTIKHDYAASLSQHGAPCTAEDVEILYFGRNNNGCIPFLSDEKYGHIPGGKQTVGGVTFEYWGNAVLLVWRFGEIYDLTEAYEHDWLDQDDLYDIRDGFYTYRESLR